MYGLSEMLDEKRNEIKVLEVKIELLKKENKELRKKDEELFSSEKVIKVRNALRIIQKNVEKIPNFLCTPSENREMSLDIEEQVKKIDSLLPEEQVK